MFYDRIFRLLDYHSQNKRVCIIGLILCPVLNCRESYNDCFVTEHSDNNKYRCLGQAIVNFDNLLYHSLEAMKKLLYVQMILLIKFLALLFQNIKKIPI